VRSVERKGARRRGRLLVAAAFAGVLVAGGVTSLATGAETEDSPQPLQEVVEETIVITEDFDGGGATYIPGEDLGGGDQDEDQLPVFEVSNGATLSNLTIGSPGADGIHCEGDCTLENITWEDVGEDAATFRGGSSYAVIGGSATGAEDKVLQHNGGGTLTVTGFTATDFGTMYRSCGNCDEMPQRHVVMDGVTANAPADTIVGINENYGDTATITNLTVVGSSPDATTVCQRYIGNDSGDEPEESGSGPDGTYCLYEDSDVTWQ
jgi:hypothetical protein